jgi:hypothetical protein
LVEPELKPVSKTLKEPSPSPSKGDKPVQAPPREEPVKIPSEKTAKPSKPDTAKPTELSKPETVKTTESLKPIKNEPVTIPKEADAAVKEPVPVPSAEDSPAEKPKENNVEPVKKTVLKKKVVKPKVSESEKVKDTESSSDTSKVEPKPTGNKVLVKQRSDANNENTSPTRIERRSSKIISQKTAELIQNLETKSSTDGPKGKKLVFPSLKVSDAKSKFENQQSDSNGTSKPAPLKSQLSVEKKHVAGASVSDKDKKSKETVELKPASTKSKSPSPKPIPAPEPAKPVEPSPTSSVKEKEVVSEVKPKVIVTIKEQIKIEEVKPKEPVKAPEPVKVVENDVAAKVPIKPVPEVKQAPVVPAEGPKPFPKAAAELQPVPVKPAVSKQTLKLKMPEPEPKPAVVTIPISRHPETSTPLTTLESGGTTGLSTTDLFFSDTESLASGKPKPFSKLPPQNKEQAAKKIGSVIQKIFSSESVPKLNRLDSCESGKTMRSEVSFPVAAAGSKERVIPIKLIDEGVNETSGSSKNSSATNLPRCLPPRMDSVRGSNSSVYSRQNSSDTESSMATAPLRPEPIKKSPREFIIPIKMETSGHTVTPKEEILNSESSTAEDNFRLDGRLRSGRFGKQRRYSSLLSDSSFEDEPLSASVSASTSRRSSNVATPSHARSLSQGDEPAAASSGTFKRGRYEI